MMKLSEQVENLQEILEKIDISIKRQSMITTCLLTHLLTKGCSRSARRIHEFIGEELDSINEALDIPKKPGM